MLADLEDAPTIRNAITKRIDGLNPAVPSMGQKISAQDVKLKAAPDIWKIILCVDIDGVPYVLPAHLPTDHLIPFYRVRRDMSHNDLLNTVDRMAEDVKTCARLQRNQKLITGEDAPMSQQELDMRNLALANSNPIDRYATP